MIWDGIIKVGDKVIDISLDPVRNSLDVLEGLSEGELRQRAILKLGADVVAGMAVSEIIEYLKE